MNIVIIGASFAGIACALEARNLYPQASIKVFEASDQLTYFPSSLQWNLRSQLKDFDPIFWKNIAELEAVDIQVIFNRPVTNIHPLDKTIETSEELISYDKLVLAMGASSDSNAIDGASQAGVFSLKTLKQGREAFKSIQKAQEIAIIGGGPIGIEMAEACLRQGKKVRLYEAGPYLDYKQFDPEFGSSLEENMRTQGIDIHLNRQIKKIETGLVIDGQANDLVLLGLNFRANSQLLEGLLDLHIDGRVKVNDDLSTSDPDIFAVGDMAYLPNQDLQAYTPLVSTAIRSGQMAAFNLLFSHQPFPPLIRMLGFRHFGNFRISVGQLESELAQPKSALVTHYQADGLRLKMVWARATGRLLGLQAESKDNCLALGNDMVTAISQGMTDHDLALRPFIFAPQEERLGLALHQACLEAWKARVMP